MNQIMEGLERSGHLVDLDEIMREGHAKYRRTPPEFLIDHSARSAASNIHDHIVAGMEKRYSGRKDVRSFEIQKLHLWLFEKVNAIIRIKKMTKWGHIAGIQTQQMKDYDAGNELPGLPPKPLRLVAGYWENKTGLEIIRTQIMRPFGQSIEWCAAIVPLEKRKDVTRIWTEVAQQRRLA